MKRSTWQGRRVVLLLALAAVGTPAMAAWVHPAAYRTEFDPAVADGDELAQIHCLALNVYHEARNEPIEGQYKVAQVTLNRMRRRDFPDTVCRVVWQPHQFSWTHDGKPDRPYETEAWKNALWIASLAWWHERFNPTGNITHFHTVYVHPYWAKYKRLIQQVGRHVFYASDAGRP